MRTAVFLGRIVYGKRLARQEHAEGWRELEELREGIEQAQ
jgi:hypothetical protein